MSEISSISAESLKTDFMTLLVTQLQHQDPLDPMKNEELTMQLATLTQLQQIEDMNAKFSDYITTFELNEAEELIGKVIEFIPDTLGERVGGTVTDVQVESGEVLMTVGPYKVSMNEILAIFQE